MHQYHENVLYRYVNVQPQSSCASSKCNAQLRAAGSALTLGRFACFQVLALVGALQDVGQHDSFHVSPASSSRRFRHLFYVRGGNVSHTCPPYTTPLHEAYVFFSFFVF